jgi:hypothetical protein
MQKKSICQVKKRSLNEIPIGSNGKLLLPCGGHLGYAIGTKITNLVEDHPVIISIMLQFHRLSSSKGHVSFYHHFASIVVRVCKLFILSSSLKPLNRFGPNLAEMFNWEVLYQICYFGADRKSNMAARANNVF